MIFNHQSLHTCIFEIADIKVEMYDQDEFGTLPQRMRTSQNIKLQNFRNRLKF